MIIIVTIKIGLRVKYFPHKHSAIVTLLIFSNFWQIKKKKKCRFYLNLINFFFFMRKLSGFLLQGIFWNNLKTSLHEKNMYVYIGKNIQY